MDSTILVKILIVGLTTVLTLTISNEKEFLKDVIKSQSGINL